MVVFYLGEHDIEIKTQLHVYCLPSCQDSCYQFWRGFCQLIFLQSASHTCKLVFLTTGNAWHWYSEENKSFYDKIISAKGVRKNKNTFDQRLAYFILFKTHCTKCFNKAVKNHLSLPVWEIVSMFFIISLIEIELHLFDF